MLRFKSHEKVPSEEGTYVTLSATKKVPSIGGVPKGRGGSPSKRSLLSNTYARQRRR